MLNGIEVPFMLFFPGCVIESYIYEYPLIWTDGNLISAMTYHFSWSLFLHLFAINPSDNHGKLFPYLCLVILELLSLMTFFPAIENIRVKK